MVPSAAASTSANRRPSGRAHRLDSQRNNPAHLQNNELFVDPMLGNPLPLYLDKDVPDRENLSQLISKHGGIVSKAYSSVNYLLVDPYTESGQSLYRQYAAKRLKVVLSYRWVNECIAKGSLQTYASEWAGCKVTGNEIIMRPSHNTLSAVPLTVEAAPPPNNINVNSAVPRNPRRELVNLHSAGPPPHIQHPVQIQARPSEQPHPQSRPDVPNTSPVYSQQAMQAASASMITPATPLGHHQHFTYGMYPPSNAQHVNRPPPPILPPPQTWQQATPITPHQGSTHVNMLPPRQQMDFSREDQWHASGSSFTHLAPSETHTMPTLAAGNNFYDQRFRDDHNDWAEPNNDYYESAPNYDTSYAAPVETYPPPPPQAQAQAQAQAVNGDASEMQAGPSTAPAPAPASAPQPVPVSAPVPPPPQPVPAREPSPPAVQERGRKRHRTPPEPVPPLSSLVLNKRWRSTRSPTPPTRIIKSTYGGNLFTADDVEYLKKYIDYCQEQGLVLSLREICERIAVKAPHHTFYSWRRYCNKHQIRLGGYAMAETRSPSPDDQENDAESGERRGSVPPTGEGPFTINDAERLYREKQFRDRSPTPPRALFRSTTGKGIAFTPEDVTFLCKYMAYRKVNNNLDLIAFWKDVAEKAPHHSRASWMKYYRRHKHELNRSSSDEPPPMRPIKKLRYHRRDDVLLARYFAENSLEGTLDKKFQNFAKIYPHHPWKGWQEHYRLHKTMIEHIITRIKNGETVEIEGEAAE